MIKCVHHVCMWCACEIHEQCMTRHSWGKVCETHNQCLKHVKNVKTWKSPKFDTHRSKKQRENVIWTFDQTLRVHTIRLNLINHFVGFIPCQFTCNSAFRYPVFRWESCKGSMWKSVKKSSRVCTQQGLVTGKSPKKAHAWSMQRSWRVMLARALQDKTSSLARQLARDLDLRLSQVKRSSRQSTLFRKN